MEERLIDNFLVTKAWVVEQLKGYFETSSEPSIEKVSVLGDTVLGYMSAITRIHLSWQDKNEKLPKTAIVKIPSPFRAEETWKACGHKEDDDQVQQEEDPIHRIMHENEVKSYTMFQKESHELLVPKLYGYKTYASGCPVLVLEDIADSTTVDLVDGFNEKQVYAIVDQLVLLHKWSETTNAPWRELFRMPEEDKAYNADFCKTMLTMNDTAKITFPDMADCLDVLVRNYMHDTDWMFNTFREAENDPQSLFNHGDLWAPQILWKGNSITGIVDWALCHAGSHTGDLLRILATCCSVGQRRKLEEPVLRYYAEQMGLAFEEIKKDYIKTLPFTCALTTFAVSMWSHSSVLRVGSPEEQTRRVREMYDRLKALIEDTIRHYSWK